MINKTLIIAEAGVNHNGDINLAKNLIEVAANAGADLIKFQTFNAERLATKSAPLADYQITASNEFQSQFDMLKKIELTDEMHRILISHAQDCGIKFFSTCFDIQGLEYLASLGFEVFKIPSGEITNLPYLRHVGRFGKPLILSSGMATIGEIEAAINALEMSGTNRSLITVLHCNSAYPTPMEDVNLRAMCSIRQALGVAVGYSDHTSGIEVSIAAVAMGATIIEKHITLDRNLIGPDHRASLEPHEFFNLVYAIRNIEQALGDGIKRPSKSENENILVVRKSLVAAKSICAGETFTPDNVTQKRPGTGISPMRLDEVIGRVANRSFDVDDLIQI